MASSRLALGGAATLAVLGATSEALADCYVDSVAGNDSNDGQSEATPVQSQAAIPSDCTVVRYKRGSRFEEPLSLGGSGFGGGTTGKTYTNYGDPSQPLPAFVTTETVVNSFQGGIIIDGLHLEGSEPGEGAMSGGGGSMGVCVQLGGGSKLLNSEITDCGIGIMLFGEGSLVQGNVVYDLAKMVADSTDTTVYANSVGGAEGIFINGSNNEVAYNQFINCKAEADWQGEGGYDGGATEVSVGEGGTVTGLKIHHNFNYNSCGFFEVSGFGTFSDSEFYYNVSIDSAWAMLLQVNETTLSNIRWENNTFVHHADAYSPSIAMIYRAELTPETVFFNNNLVIFDGAPMFNATLDPAFSASNNLIVDYDPGVLNIKGTSAADFDLLETSEARDQGLLVPGHTIDFLGRTAPDPSGVTDIGAFEYGSSQGAPVPEVAQVPPEPDPSEQPADGSGGTPAVPPAEPETSDTAPAETPPAETPVDEATDPAVTPSAEPAAPAEPAPSDPAAPPADTGGATGAPGDVGASPDEAAPPGSGPETADSSSSGNAGDAPNGAAEPEAPQAAPAGADDADANRGQRSSDGSMVVEKDDGGCAVTPRRSGADLGWLGSLMAALALLRRRRSQ